MSRFRTSEFLRQFAKTNFKGFRPADFRNAGRPASPLIVTPNFGSNPGRLKMYSYVPAGLPNPAPLVVVLHGCTQTAAGYDVGAGWSTLAERYGFAVLMPEQQQTNNANLCFSWFNPEDCTRNQGEACSIRQMIARLAKDHDIDSGNIFVTGLSAGGAMTSVMLATYPEVFAGGAIIAGLPFGVASNVEEALTGMRQTPSLTPGELGDMVRAASPHNGPWPKVSVWHGRSDFTVNPSNALAIVQQWLDVHGLPLTPMSRNKIDGHDHAIWWNGDGETIVESYDIASMAHGAPLGTGESNEFFGMAGPYLIDAGISSSYHIARFFGLTDKVHRARPAEQLFPSLNVPAGSQAKSESQEGFSGRFSKIDVNEIITKALTSAGLMRK